MKTIEKSKASKTLAEYTEDLSEDVIVVTSHRKPIAALISLEGVDTEAAALGSNPRFLGILKRSYQEIQAGLVVSHNQMKREFGPSKTKTVRKRVR